MFLKRTHSHPNNTGVDLENTAAGFQSIYSALLLIYILTVSSLFINIARLTFCSLLRKKKQAECV